MVPKGVALGMLFYLTCAVAATIYISLMYLNEKECDCRQYVKRLSLPESDSLDQEHDFNHLSKLEEVPTKRQQEKLISTSRPEKLSKEEEKIKQQNQNDEKNWGTHVLGIVVPYRNRFEELMDFVPHMHTFLTKKKLRHRIFIVNQVDKHRFNRASLLNVGYLVARNECDYIAMHDVDLMPLNNKLFYGYPDKGPFHVSAPHLHPKYHYKTFVGGILMMTTEQFEKVNGLSNRFWGWGREDDELYQRMMEAGLTIYRHGKKHIKTGYDTFKHEHDPKTRKRDYARIYDQKRESFHRDRETGLDSVEYTITSKKRMVIDEAPCTIVNVELECDYDFTPWCDLEKKGRS